MDATADASTRKPAAFIGRRLLSLLYDLLPVVALWFLAAVPFVLLDVAVSGDVRHNIGPFSLLQWLLWLACWIVTGLYATVSWRRGGQTLGMRPWRLRVVADDGGAPTHGALWRRYAVGMVSLLVAGVGFWWAWIDRERLTWHDRASGTRIVRMSKRN
ncbi:RDD family protein [Luteimonas marina]|uniref:RDD family protein n=1 Tax=Luteimonas marina TaxID=488485 RepID=A0A5C5U299_9GAMM|nr:RDD family protein [Luteimonas marina]TWT20106.1 RDD family protein [Luteimonas marina]